jgi:hypothetical protein
VPPRLWAEVQEADRLLIARCGDRLFREEEEEDQLIFAQHRERCWSQLAETDEVLIGALELLFEANLPKFRKEFERGLKQRRIALAKPLAELKRAGERGGPHLAIALTSDSWAGVLAAGALEAMPSGPLRDRALVDSLFLADDWVSEAGERSASGILLDRRWSLFDLEAQEANAAGIELHSLHWVALFEESEGDESTVRPTPHQGRAALLLYDLGHHSALVAGLSFLLDPAVYGQERVQRNLVEGGIELALRVIAERPPQHVPSRSKSES